MKKLNIYLVDDHALFREGLKFLLSNLEYAANIYEADNGQEFLDGLAIHAVDLALIDIEMPGVNGIDATAKALELYPAMKIIALSMYSDENYYSSMIDAGASGFLLKDSNFTEVRKAIEEVCAGRNYFSVDILQAILKRLNRQKNKSSDNSLTERETEILFHICRGLSNTEIAEQLCISKRTVDKHRENLLQKTNSKNTASLVIFAIKNGHFQI